MSWIDSMEEDVSSLIENSGAKTKAGKKQLSNKVIRVLRSYLEGRIQQSESDPVVTKEDSTIVGNVRIHKPRPEKESSNKPNVMDEKRSMAADKNNPFVENK